MTLIRTCEVRAVRQCGEVVDFYKACDLCRREVLRWLGEIEDGYQRLSAIPSRAAAAGGGSHVPGPKSPAVDHVIAMLDRRSSPAGPGMDDRPDVYSIPAVIEGWCREAWAGREVPFPGTMGEAFIFLRWKTDWHLRQDHAGDYARELRDLLAQLRVLTEPRRKIGECPTVLGEYRDQVVRCEAPLRANVHDDTIRCNRCGARWERPWLDLVESVRQLTVLSYADLAIWFAVPVSTLRNWSGEDGWTRGGTERRPTWRVVDALRSYVSRRVDKLAG